MKSLLTPRRLLILAFAVMLGAITYWFWFSRGEKVQVTLETTEARRENIQISITATGRVQPIDQVEVGTEVSGTVARIDADFNQKVSKGQILMELDKKKAQSKVEQSQASFEAAQNEERYLKSVLERTRRLAQGGGTTAVDVETAEYKYNAAVSSLTRARNDLEQSRLDLANCTIRSPIDGVVLSRDIEVGQTVAASLSAPTLFIIARDLTRMEVKADVDEADIGQVQAGQKVAFTVDAHPQDVFNGVVSEVRLSPTINSNVVTYTVVIEADNANARLLPGMTATCDIAVQEAVQAIVLPTKALQFQPTEATPGYTPPPEKSGSSEKKGERRSQHKRQEGSGNSALVWIRDGQGSLHPRRIRTGISDGVLTEITEGLSEKETVATGMVTVSEKTSAQSSDNASSPFMPKRPSGRQRQGGPPPH